MKMFRDLKVKLTEAEWCATASALGAEQAKLYEVELEKQSMMATLKARIGTHEERMAQLGELVRSREETRAVECFERKDEKKFVVELYRADTGVLVESRSMTAAERHDVLQVKLPGISREPPEDGEPN